MDGVDARNNGFKRLPECVCAPLAMHAANSFTTCSLDSPARADTVNVKVFSCSRKAVTILRVIL